MLEMIEERKSSTVSDEKRDLMSNWIHASMAGGKSVGKEPTLDQRDILGNIFVFLIAGALLALVFIPCTDLSKKDMKLRHILWLLHWRCCQFIKTSKRSSTNTSALWCLRVAFLYGTGVFVLCCAH